MKKFLNARPKIIVSLCLVATLTLAGCLTAPNHYMRDEIAKRLATPAWMVGRDIPTGTMTLKVYERIHDNGGSANLYIEGDGEAPGASLKSQDLTFDPTPRNPVALHLATKDNAENVIYLARPCQYTGVRDGRQTCPREYWGEGRYGPEIMQAYNTALDEIKRRYNISGFHITGYGGGAAIATRLAGQREDVLSLRSVAGKLDEGGHSAGLADMPQTHFIGGQDNVVRPAVLHDYLKSLGPTRCARYSFIQEASHERSWVDKWPALLQEPVSCQGQKKDLSINFAVPPPVPSRAGEGVYTSREMPAKP